MPGSVLFPHAIAALLIAAASSVSFAGERSPRFTMSPADGGGFVRLDTVTGAMAHCLQRQGEWTCRDISAAAAPASQSELERLQEENKRLKAEIRQMEDILLSDKRVPEASEKDRAFSFRLPTEQEVDQALTYAQRMLRKLREKMKELEGEAKGTPL